MVLFSFARILLSTTIPEVHAIYSTNGTKTSPPSIEPSTLSSTASDSGSFTIASTESSEPLISTIEIDSRTIVPSPSLWNNSLPQSDTVISNYTTPPPSRPLSISNVPISVLGSSDGNVTSPSASSQGSYATESNTNPFNYSITSDLPLYLTTYVGDDNKTITECPYTRYHNAHAQRMRNETCCNYYNPDLDTLAFSSWISEGNANPSPSLGAKYGCCGHCTIRAQSIQVYYWPDGGELTRCITGTTTFVVTYTENYTDTARKTWTKTLSADDMSDKAYGCNNNHSVAYVPYSMVLDGHTLISPTPYIRFTSVRAYDYCGSFSDDSQAETDDIFEAVTAPIKTVLSIGPDGPVYAQLNWTEYAACTSDCNPILSHQHVKYGNNRYGLGAYYLCHDVGYGYLDPPIALTKVDSLDDPVTAPPAAGATRAPIPVATSKADPGSGTNQVGNRVQGGSQGSTTSSANPAYSPSDTAKSAPAGQAPSKDQAPQPIKQAPSEDQAPKEKAQQKPPGAGQLQSSKGLAQKSDYTPGFIPSYTPGIDHVSPNAPNGAQPGPTHPAVPAITIGSSIYKPDAASHYIVGSQTLIPGGPAITVAGTLISLAPSTSALVVHDQTQILSTVTPFVLSSPITIGPQRLDTLPNGQGYVMGSQTLLPGKAAIVVAGTTFSLNPAGTALVIDGTSTLALSPSSIPPSPPNILTIGSQTLTGNGAGKFIYGSQTLAPGGAAITVNGLPVSLLPGASALVFGLSAVSLNPSSSTQFTLVVGAHTLTANAAGQYVYGTQTVSYGGPAITVDGHVVLIPPDRDDVVVVDGRTLTTGGNPEHTALGKLIMAGLGGTTSTTTYTSISPGSSSSSNGTSFQAQGTNKSSAAEYVTGKEAAIISTDEARTNPTSEPNKNWGSRSKVMACTDNLMIRTMMILGMGVGFIV